MAVHDVLGILDTQRTTGQVARVGIVLTTFYQVALEIFVGNDGLAADNGMAAVGNGCRNALDSRCQMGDIGTDVSIATGDNLRQFATVVGDDERQSVQFPGNPDGALLGPLHQFRHLFCLGQREGCKLMFLLLSGHIVFTDLLSR